MTMLDPASTTSRPPLPHASAANPAAANPAAANPSAANPPSWTVAAHDDAALILRMMAEVFYEAVPIEYKTFCVYVSQIAQAALTALGFQATLRPCRLELTRHQERFVIGFTGKAPPGQWDGHVAVQLERHLFDAAAHGLRRISGIPVPDIVVIPVGSAPPPILGGLQTRDGIRITWFDQPADQIDGRLPLEPDRLVQPLADAVATAIRRRLLAAR